jgi:hypothetical protein
LLAGNEAQLKAAYGAVDTSLAADVTARIGRIQQTATTTHALEQDVLTAAAKPKPERDIKDAQAWFDGIGALVTGLTDLSRSIAGEARLADPVIGEYVLARQYS